MVENLLISIILKNRKKAKPSVMKNIIKNILAYTLLICFILLATNIFADLPPDPGTGGPGTGDIPVGGGSPIGGGLFILLSLGIAYGSKKLFELRNKIK